MAITTAICNSFKTELLKGYHDLHGSSTIKMALIKDSPSGTYNSPQQITQLLQVILMRYQLVEQTIPQVDIL